MVDESVAPETLTERSLRAVAEYIKSLENPKIVFLTGAGISTAAGIPDFRSAKTGLYSKLEELKLPYAEAVFDISYFRQNPEPFYVLAQELYPGKFHPTVSHAFISLLAQRGFLLKLFTQNIDCLERQAGIPADRIVEAHGSFATQSCIDCKTEFPDQEMKYHIFGGTVPRCKVLGCNGLVKPDIVFFGEGMPKNFLENLDDASKADVLIILGTSLCVYPFAGLPDMVGQGKPRVLFNMERVGKLGTRADDVIALGSCDAGIRKLADELGCREELETYWRGLVGHEEAERQLRSTKERHEELEDEVNKLAAGVESALKLEPWCGEDGGIVAEDAKKEAVVADAGAASLPTSAGAADAEEQTKASTERSCSGLGRPADEADEAGQFLMQED